jgi:hypothetical protein
VIAVMRELLCIVLAGLLEAVADALRALPGLGVGR